MIELTLFYYNTDGVPEIMDTDSDHFSVTSASPPNAAQGQAIPLGVTVVADETAILDQFIPWHAVLAIDMPKGDRSLWQL